MDAGYEMLEAVRNALGSKEEGPDDAHTVAELAEQMGSGEMTVRKAIRALLKTGDAECIRVRRRAMDGTLRPVPAYRLRPAT